VNVTHLPTTGALLWVRLQYEVIGTWQFVDYTYTEF
jgi:hypothetical protein